jgi:hypothetical protein
MKGNFYIFCSSKNSRHVVIYIFKISRSINHLRIHHFLKLRFYQHYLRYTVGQGEFNKNQATFLIYDAITSVHLPSHPMRSLKWCRSCRCAGVITPTSM